MADPTTVAEQNTGPAIRITRAEAGASKVSGSDSRSFNYCPPKGRQASVYEDVTVDVQPDPTRHLLQGWLYAFADGVAGFSETWTKVKSSDWHVFRDPNEQGHRTIYIRQANTVRQIQQTLAMAKRQAGVATWDRSWVKCVEKNTSAWMHPEFGLGMQVFVPAKRHVMTNMINN